MIVLKISNASEVVATKVGKFIESLTPDGFDQAKVEDIVIKKLIENLSAEGLHGEVASVRGLDLDHSQLVLHDRLHVRSQQQF
ncbi:MAG: hypothetical protein ACK5FE_00490 [Cyanobacteriota bacterium]|jgi:hypothetical protein